MSERPISGESLGKALAFASGDMRDWPMECPLCMSRDLTAIPELDRYRCGDCRHEITGEIVAERRHEIARADVLGAPKPKPWF